MGVARLALETELALKGLRFVGTRGNLGAPVCFVGEAPGADEDSAGKPFVGPSGRLLDAMISEGGLDASACWFTNPYKTRPPDNKIDRLPELGIDLKVYQDEFFEELNDAKPTFVVACGATPLNLLCPQTASKTDNESKIGKWRGSLLTSPRLGWPHYIFPIFHPAFILRTWDEKYFNTFLLAKLAAELAFWKTNGRIQPLPIRSILHTPTFDESFEYLQACLASKDILSVDIELLRRKYPYTISFALSSTSAISIGFTDYADVQATTIWRLMGRVLASKKVLGQNYTNFDMYWLCALGLQPNIQLVDDTRIRHAVLWPELSHKLDFMTIQYTRQPYYKEEGKGWSKLQGGQGIRQLRSYNCMDTLVTREIYDVQEMEFADKCGVQIGPNSLSWMEQLAAGIGQEILQMAATRMQTSLADLYISTAKFMKTNSVSFLGNLKCITPVSIADALISNICKHSQEGNILNCTGTRTVCTGTSLHQKTQERTMDIDDVLSAIRFATTNVLPNKSKESLAHLYMFHELPLAQAMWTMEHRGMLCDEVKMNELRSYIKAEQANACARSEKLVGKTIVISAKQQELVKKTGLESVNISSAAQLIEVLKARGIKIPKNRMTGNETTSEEKLNELYANTGDEFLKEILRIRELNKIEGTYVDCTRPHSILYSTYIVGGTVTGRRSAKAICLGYGLNHQNIPKHSPLGKKFRSCIVARPGRILINCDQISAEDWIVQGIIADVSGDDSGVQELISGVDRHQKLAARIFGLPLDECSKEAEKAGKIYRYVGKRTRHASHYDMQGAKLSAVFAKEGFSIPTTNCVMILEQFHKIEPNIKGVFHEYIKKEITDKRRLTNLFNRTRDFFGFCPWRDNSQVFRDAYSYIPQGSVGDNTGEALLVCESRGLDFVLAEAHDALLLEVEDNFDSVRFAIRLLQRAFKRTLTFARGYQLEIPVEFDMGYNMKDMRGCGDLSEAGLTSTLVTLHQQARPHQTTSSGQLQLQ